ncbi:ABC transporter ATP-binding protein [Aliidiomarina taiwanensis]|uniref:ABC transporter ATP-binding protein n=1 Tax=Aliidiomarina taiwanensis TaxID=946228 RepID=A0A432X1V9_9GAMM|nr:ATP-binding cassette domain-containing protein [Aliidiomarina taiwanensis]RUO40546.1 ABC transporter ATP-binding protein [Aliidiomarina taiwanensis]
MAVIQAHSIHRYVDTPEGRLTILDDINLTIDAGETLAIVGASGSGKSTLLALLAGLDLPNRGHVSIDGVNLSHLSEEQRAVLRGEQVGFVFQSFLLVHSLTALENVMLPAELAGAEAAEAQAKELLTQVGLADRIHHYPNQLSGGEQQRVAIARAFIGRPQLLFADEPTGNLDRATGKKIEQLLFDLNRAYGTSLIIVTHDQQLAAQCGRTVNIDHGRVQELAKYEA